MKPNKWSCSLEKSHHEHWGEACWFLQEKKKKKLLNRFLNYRAASVKRQLCLQMLNSPPTKQPTEFLSVKSCTVAEESLLLLKWFRLWLMKQQQRLFFRQTILLWGVKGLYVAKANAVKVLSLPFPFTWVYFVLFPSCVAPHPLSSLVCIWFFTLIFVESSGVFFLWSWCPLCSSFPRSRIKLHPLHFLPSFSDAETLMQPKSIQRSTVPIYAIDPQC